MSIKAEDNITLESKKPLYDSKQHFWFWSEIPAGKDPLVGTGAHISEVSEDDFNNPNNPNYHKGGNLLARSNGVAVRDGLTELAVLISTGAQIGKENETHVKITDRSFKMEENGGADVVPFVWLSDLKNDSGYYEAEESFVRDWDYSYAAGKEYFDFAYTAIVSSVKVHLANSIFTSTSLLYSGTTGWNGHAWTDYTITFNKLPTANKTAVFNYAWSENGTVHTATYTFTTTGDTSYVVPGVGYEIKPISLTVGGSTVPWLTISDHDIYVGDNYVEDEGTIVVEYITESEETKAFTFGYRKDEGFVGAMSFSHGTDNTASGRFSVALGRNLQATSTCAHAEGSGSKALNACAHAEGSGSEASGINSHAEGTSTKAINHSCHAEGYGTTASSYACHAEGDGSQAKGYACHASNQGTIASGLYQTAIGRYNIENDATYFPNAWDVFIVGNGSGNSSRSNALRLTMSGNLNIAGTLTQGSDKRLKEHISYLDEDAVKFIRKLKPAHFIKDEARHVGFYAQDVQEADEWDCMTGEMNGYMTLGYTELIAPLVAYCQHLEDRIRKLEEK